MNNPIFFSLWGPFWPGLIPTRIPNPDQVTRLTLNPRIVQKFKKKH
jgi:hypothetical protein